MENYPIQRTKWSNELLYYRTNTLTMAVKLSGGVADEEKIARFVNISNESGKRSRTDEGGFICCE